MKQDEIPATPIQQPLQILMKKTVVLVSGGVDSAVAAMLVKGPASFWFIDNGLQRKGEVDHVKAIFARHSIEVKVLDAKSYFLKILKDCETGKKKRDVIGEGLVKKAIKIARSERAKSLVFGTIKNDLLVSDECSVTKIKGYGLIEPLRNLTKKEVIRIAKNIGLEEFVKRQHFPGVGFAVRIEGAVTPQKLKLIRELTEFIEKFIDKSGLKYFAYFPVLLKGNNILLRIVESDDGLIARVGDINQSVMDSLATDIIKRFPVRRVFLDLTPRPLNYIEYE